jgi:hypothetical protein
VHLALADLAGARTLMREVDELLRRRPGVGNLVGEAEALRARLAEERGSSVPGASAMTTAGHQRRTLEIAESASLAALTSYPRFASMLVTSFAA